MMSMRISLMIITSPSLILTFDGGGSSFHRATFNVTKGRSFNYLSDLSYIYLSDLSIIAKSSEVK